MTVKQQERIERLEFIIDRLQAALGVSTLVELKPGFGDIVKIYLHMGVHQQVLKDAKLHPVIVEAIRDTFVYKLEKMLQEGSGGNEEVVKASKK